MGAVHYVEESASSWDENPLREGVSFQRRPDPCSLVIFGATGDLTHRKLVPALFNLALGGLLPAGVSAVGFARREKTHEVFRQEMRQAVEQFSRTRLTDEAVWQDFERSLFYSVSQFDDLDAYRRLGQLLDRLDVEKGSLGNRLFYLATPPSFYQTIIARLGEAGLNVGGKGPSGRGWARVIVEKPFGRDIDSAVKLNQDVSAVFDESQVFRIDHYLGKETVQNILVLRFANGIFEPIWNRRYVDHVQITVAESVGVESRGAYYEEAGALRDMVQSHLLQLLALTAMEPPVAYDADAVRDEKVKVLRALRPIRGESVDVQVVRGQYGPGFDSGHPVPGYRQEARVAAKSSTETYVALKVFIDNWRWQGVPFYLRTGKHLPKRSSEIVIQFKRPPLTLFSQTESTDANYLILRIQPDEGVTLRFGVKTPGQTMQIRTVNMDFLYGASFGVDSPDAYERLLLDAMLGDSTLFTRRDEVEKSWAFITDILKTWQEVPLPDFPNYEAGTWGPLSADELLARDGRVWHRP
ncbi:MAG: glucose-6-phosphate dehydrogenase [Chloroflexi bacterium]|nr:glucose-6-phosphate dehydrogenase [Chloroflexota bacterium]